MLAMTESDSPVGKTKKARALREERIGLPSHVWNDSTVGTTGERHKANSKLRLTGNHLFFANARAELLHCATDTNAYCNQR